MNTYRITTFVDGEKFASQDVPCAQVIPHPGQILKFTKACYTLANNSYKVGDELILLGRTQKAPHAVESSLGNWVVKCKNTVSVWACIEWTMAQQALEITAKEMTREQCLMKLRREGQFEIYENTFLDLRMARPRFGGRWVLSDLKSEIEYDTDRYRHDLAERFSLILELES